jgi:hypothetical protein
MFANGRALMSTVCGPDVRDATELFRTWSGTNREIGIWTLILLGAEENVQQFSHGRIRGATRITLPIRIRVK